MNAEAQRPNAQQQSVIRDAMSLMFLAVARKAQKRGESKAERAR